MGGILDWLNNCKFLTRYFTAWSLSSIFNSFNFRFRMRWDGNVTRMGERRGVYRVLVGKTEGKRLLGRPRRRWEDNIKVNLQEI